MQKISNVLGLSQEAASTIVSSILTVISIFLTVTIGYYIYHYLFEKRK